MFTMHSSHDAWSLCNRIQCDHCLRSFNILKLTASTFLRSSGSFVLSSINKHFPSIFPLCMFYSLRAMVSSQCIVNVALIVSENIPGSILHAERLAPSTWGNSIHQLTKNWLDQVSQPKATHSSMCLILWWFCTHQYCYWTYSLSGGSRDGA